MGNKISNRWTQGFLKIILVLTLLVPVGSGYSVHNDFSGRLKTEQLYSTRKKQRTGYFYHHYQKILFNEIRNKKTYCHQSYCFEKSIGLALKNQGMTFLIVKNKTKQLLFIDLISSNDDFVKIM